MPTSDDVRTPALRRARRWPAALAAILAVGSLVLAGALFARDRQNANAATASQANAGQDDLALATLQSLSKTVRLDVALGHAGIVGLARIDVRAVESRVVAPLGGILQRLHDQWTLALDGGFACLTWHRGGTATAARGVCSDNTPLVVAPPVSTRQFRAAERRASRVERTVAAQVALGVASVRAAPPTVVRTAYAVR